MNTNKLIQNVNEILKNVMETGVHSVISGKKKRFKALYIHQRMIEEYMKSLKFEQGDRETNGWQHDWWLPFKKDGKSYTAFGSAYDGKFEFFDTTDEEEE